MKGKKAYWILLAICFVLGFPFLLRIIVSISTCFLELLNIPAYINITKAYEIDFADYLIVTISLMSCICTGVVGYMAYKLSLTVYSSENAKNNYYKLYVIGKILYDIKQNAEIITQRENKIQSRYKEIELSSAELINVLYFPLSKEQINRLHDIYAMFSKYKESGMLSPGEKEKWILENGNVNIEDIINELEKGERMLYAKLN